MKYYVTVLDSKRHDAFLRQQRKDPVTKEIFKAGDRVVMCAGTGCQSAFLETSWLFRGQRHCGQSGTLKSLEVDDTEKRFSKRAAHDYAHNFSETGAENSSPFPKEQSAERTPERGAVRLRDVPLRLMDIAVQLNPIIKLRDI
ncbi:MAG: hypothetical protein AUG51_19955 [Acidobacteria bacterium 13_1_20CM_3_53_8]|nr:MAG: hypothetical protein AUG51_19955 [Acidobacteria bacterium 13_1_20CM_3_53_8]